MTWSRSSVTSSTVPNNGFGSQAPTIPSVAKRIQEEWKILEKDLPVTIFVRAYETRMDRVRAVIVGAEATPYHDGLFFFDVCFPSGYPNVPPVEASTNQLADQQMPVYNLASKILCWVINVSLKAEPDTDEVFAQVTLLPEANKGLIDSDALTHKRNAKSTTPFKSDH